MQNSLTVKNWRVCKRSAQNTVESPEKVFEPNTFRRVKNICAYIKRFLLGNRLDGKEDSMSTGAKYSGVCMRKRGVCTGYNS